MKGDFMKGGVKLTPWQKIVRAYKRGTGLRLSSEEIDRLNMDDAITTRADNDDRGLNHNEAHTPPLKVKG